MSVKTIGVISDTHGLFRDVLKDIFNGVDLILHAGDIGDERVIHELNNIAHTVAVYGNTDNINIRYNYPKTKLVSFHECNIYLVHNLEWLDVVPSTADIHIVIHGHTHTPEITHKDGVLFLNPGSAGHKRAHKPVSVAIVQVSKKGITPRLIEIEP
ncbi:MAG: metallophosphatase family protein [Thermodesulfovibrionales bacterium]|nr:metallophosphatase family protein [Thermodesulfovibrionales bacterium]